jgi:hypothetical protein
MGSIRQLRRRADAAVPKPVDLSPIIESLRPHVEKAFQADVLKALRTEGPSTLKPLLGSWSFKLNAEMKISIEEPCRQQWFRELVNAGTVLNDGDIYWLAHEAFPPSHLAVEVYSNVPIDESKAESAAQIATRLGLAIESVEIALAGICRTYRWYVSKTKHPEPRYYRIW